MTVPQVEESSLVQLLASLEDGGVLREGDRQLAELGRAIRAAQESGKTKSTGALTVKLRFADSEGVVMVAADIAITPPKRQRFRQVVHLGRDGTPRTHDPKQANLFDNEPQLAVVGASK